MTGTAATAPPRMGVRFRRWPLSLRIGLAIVTVHVVLALFGPWLAPFEPTTMRVGVPLSGMSWQHPFGLDQLGRDVFSRTLHGAPIVLSVSLAGTLAGFLLGAFAGLVSGTIGGRLDLVAMRVAEALISIPMLFLALLIVALVGARSTGTMALLVLVIAFVYAPRVARMARAVAIEATTRDYVAAARLRGDPAWRVALAEILPNVSSTLLVEFALRAAYAPVLVASLGFLGFGIRPPTPEWGLLISENRNLVYLTPATVLGPGMMLATLVIGINLLTDGIARMVGRSSAAARG